MKNYSWTTLIVKGAFIIPPFITAAKRSNESYPCASKLIITWSMINSNCMEIVYAKHRHLWDLWNLSKVKRLKSICKGNYLRSWWADAVRIIIIIMINHIWNSWLLKLIDIKCIFKFLIMPTIQAYSKVSNKRTVHCTLINFLKDPPCTLLLKTPLNIFLDG